MIFEIFDLNESEYLKQTFLKLKDSQFIVLMKFILIFYT